MAEKPEDLNLPNAVVSRLAKDAVIILCLPQIYSQCVFGDHFPWGPQLFIVAKQTSAKEFKFDDAFMKRLSTI